ncbi:sugar nucleotide-binding protein [Micromonospora polyrhachis]|uniref:dTDP-4-dehydrorhamnose reductase n=1 Tax=Micromonospora polyrhachis TaxID=1282883 RepID=A0A7W7WRU6_9ACTN|nr:sugar nucleotide-binding protein [Micromonospora polyrhachis]MBB4961636.1 dTDP-4-dehydrorhamnose reductase [Micromonospora polyrhachis]
MTLLVVGASGHLGGEVCRRALAAGQRVVGTYRRAPGVVDGVDWRPLDVRDRAAVGALIGTLQPRVVVNCAFEYASWVVTADGAAHVALAAAEAGARLVHLSSDAVHGGRCTPYLDDEPPAPVFPYGAAKAAAETAVRLVDPSAALVRTSVIVGDAASRQVRLCFDAISETGSVALFSDEIRCPISVDDLAAAVLELVESDHAGLINVAGPEAVSRVEFGLLVARVHGLDPARMRTTTIAESGLARPPQVQLDSGRAAALLTTPLRAVSEFLSRP